MTGGYDEFMENLKKIMNAFFYCFFVILKKEMDFGGRDIEKEGLLDQQH